MEVDPTNRVTVSCYDWDVQEIDERFEVWSWGYNRQGDNVFLRFHNVPVFAHIELPMFVENKYRDRTFWEYHYDRIVNYININLRENRPYKCIFVEKMKMYYYRHGRKYPMILAAFRDQKSLYMARKLLEKPTKIEGVGVFCFRMHDVDVKAHRKMLSMKKLKYTQWFNVNANLVEERDRISTFTDQKKEYIVTEWNSIDPIPNSETMNWRIHPTVMSFDLEAYSPNHKVFPRGSYYGNYIYIATCIFQKVGLPNTRKRVAIIRGDCDEIPNVEIVKCTEELDLLSCFGQITQKYDPDIIIGYNIMGFDYSYIDDRIGFYHVEWPKMSRIKDHKTSLYTKPLNSDALGKNKLSWPIVPGRISVDAYRVVKRDYKFTKYDLGTVSKSFLGRGKHDVPPQEQFRIYQKWLIADKSDIGREDAKNELTRVVAYGVEDSELVIDLFEKLNLWSNLTVLSAVAGLPMMQLYTGGQQMRGFSLIYDKAYQANIVMDTQPANMTLRYEGAFVATPIRGLHDNIICMDFASLYPSIIMAYNIDFTTFVPSEDHEISDEECHVIEWTETVDDDDNDDELELGDIFDALEEPKKKKKNIVEPQKYRFRFYKAPKDTPKEDYPKYWGIVPRLVHELVSERKYVRKELIPNEKDPVVLGVLDALQNALKTMANSIYGLFGVREGGIIPLIEAAMCVTATGRKSIQNVNSYIREKYNGEIIYGDSVTAETPVLIRYLNRPFNECGWYYPIESLFDENCMQIEGKIRQQLFNVEVWSDMGWTKVKYIMKHRCKKRIYEIHTGTGIVRVTEDHSLLRPDGTVVRPKDLKIGERLLHADLPNGTIKSVKLPSDKEKITQMYGVDAANRRYLFWMRGIIKVDKEISGIFDEEDHYDRILEIREIKYDGYVYDLETENHHFSAGIGRIVVHNTDSSFVNIHIKDPKEVNDRGAALAKEITALFPPPMAIEFEKAVKVLLLKKKFYGYWLIAKDGTFKKDSKGKNIIATKGIVLARRDNFKWLQDTYRPILENILGGGNLSSSINILMGAVKNLITGVTPMEEFIIVKGLGAHYKNPNYAMKLYADELARSGRPAQPGERIEFVVYEKPEERYLGRRMCPPGDIEAHGLKVDYLYYLHLATKSLQKLIVIGHMKEIRMIPDGVGYKPPGRYHFIPFRKIMRLIRRLIQDGHDTNVIYSMLEPPKVVKPSIRIIKPKAKILM